MEEGGKRRKGRKTESCFRGDDMVEAASVPGFASQGAVASLTSPMVACTYLPTSQSPAYTSLQAVRVNGERLEQRVKDIYLIF